MLAESVGKVDGDLARPDDQGALAERSPSAYRTHGPIDACPQKEHRAGSSDANLQEVAFLTVEIESEAEEDEGNGHAGDDGTDVPATLIVMRAR